MYIIPYIYIYFFFISFDQNRSWYYYADKYILLFPIWNYWT